MMRWFSDVLQDLFHWEMGKYRDSGDIWFDISIGCLEMIRSQSTVDMDKMNIYVNFRLPRSWRQHDNMIYPLVTLG